MEPSNIKLDWNGPYEWPIAASTLPDSSGVYLWTFPFQNGFIVYAAGITRRPFADRFREHTRGYLNGTYTIFDTSALLEGRRVERWHGFFFGTRPPERESEFELRREELEGAAREQLTACKVFVAEVPKVQRLLERLEAAIMNQLYTGPFSEIPDRGMMLAPRWESEEPIVVSSTSPCVLHGLQNVFEV